MVRVRNAGKVDYVGSLVEVRAGAEAEVSDETAAYLLSSRCPGEFVRVEPEQPSAQPPVTIYPPAPRPRRGRSS